MKGETESFNIQQTTEVFTVACFFWYLNLYYKTDEITTGVKLTYQTAWRRYCNSPVAKKNLFCCKYRRYGVDLETQQRLSGYKFLPVQEG